MVEVLYSDNHILVVNKPAGLSTQPSPTSDDSLEVQCKAWLKNEFNKPGNVFLHALHRLDKPVSGIVLFARTSKALSRLNEAMRARQMQKIYLAILEGTFSSDRGHLEHYLIHGDHYAHVGLKKNPQAKYASLHYKVIAREQNQTEVEIQLETGRYHQIRAQMAAIGHPVLGDRKYGSQIPFPNEGIALHHAKFIFPHPISRTPIVVNSQVGKTNRSLFFAQEMPRQKSLTME